MKTPLASALLAAPVLFALAAASPATAQAASCTLPEPIAGTVRLKPGCTYRETLRITTSGTSVDCQGATLDAQGERRSGLVIDSAGKPLRDVTVRDCTIVNAAGAGVYVGWQTKDTRKAGKEPDHARRQALYDRHPAGVVLERLRVIDSGGVGIYIDDYVTDTLVKDSEVRGSTSTGFYLEHSSARTTITGTLITGNGHRGLFRDNREGIAIDSSAGNRIVGNRFERNGAGGVFLYKNCSEHFGSGDQVRRWQPADDNEISGNLFVDERIGVWIASRQSRDLSAWGCGDPALDRAGTFFEDHAEGNVVSGNRFCGIEVGVRVEDDNNTVTGNLLSKIGDRAVLVVEDNPMISARGGTPLAVKVAGNKAGPEACEGVR